MSGRRPPRNNKRQKPHLARQAAGERQAAPRPAERKPPTEYGKPFVVLEDGSKNTFVYDGGTWVPHSMTIDECRKMCLVKELPQKVNRMVRYEIRCPELRES